MPGVVVIPHAAGPIAVDMVVLQSGAPTARGFGGAGVGERFGKEHHVAGIAGDFDSSGRVEPRSAPALLVEFYITLVRSREDDEATVARVIGREHGDHVEHRRADCAVAHSVFLGRQAVVPTTGSTSLIFRDRPGVHELRLVYEFLQVGKIGRVCDQLVENGVEPGQAVESNLTFNVGVFGEVLALDDWQALRPAFVVVYRLVFYDCCIQFFDQVAVYGSAQDQKTLEVEKETLFCGNFVHMKTPVSEHYP